MQAFLQPPLRCLHRSLKRPEARTCDMPRVRVASARLRLVPSFGHLELRQLTRARVEAYVAREHDVPGIAEAAWASSAVGLALNVPQRKGMAGPSGFGLMR